MTATGVLRVLVVDDSLTVRRLVEIALRGKPMLLEFATNGAEAIAAVLRAAPDVMLLDLVLPDMTGVDLCRELERRGAANIPIVVISGNQAKARTLFSFYPRVIDFMSKPFGAADVLRVLSAVASKAPKETATIAEPAQASPHEVFSAVVLRDQAFRFLATALQVVGDGEIQLQTQTEQTSFFVRDESIAMITTRDAERYLVASGFDQTSVAPSILRAALKEQEESGQPFVVALASYLPSIDVRAFIYREGIALLKLALSGPTASSRLQFRALKPPKLPEYLASYAASISIPQLELLSLRERRYVANHLDEEGTVERVRGFAARIADFDLNGEERCILLRVIDRSAIRAVLTEAKLERREATLALSRLTRMGLLQYCPPGEPVTTKLQRDSVLLIADSDVTGVEQPLAQVLRERAMPIKVESLGPAAGWLERVARFRPTAILINVDEAHAEGEHFAQALRRMDAFHGTGLIAVADRMDSARSRWLRSVGYDAALEKPFHVTALEPFLLP
jgi:CheY-like chemotaxis protein